MWNNGKRVGIEVRPMVFCDDQCDVRTSCQVPCVSRSWRQEIHSPWERADGYPVRYEFPNIRRHVPGYVLPCIPYRNERVIWEDWLCRDVVSSLGLESNSIPCLWVYWVLCCGVATCVIVVPYYKCHKLMSSDDLYSTALYPYSSIWNTTIRSHTWHNHAWLVAVNC